MNPLPRLLALAGLGLSLGSGGAASAERGLYAEYQDWVLGCDNVRTCRAVGSKAAEATGAALFVDRSGEGGARPTVQLLVPAPAGVAQARAEGLELVADGRSLGIVRDGHELRLAPDSGEVGWIGALDEPAITASLVQALRTAKALTLRRPGGSPLGTVSLDGAAAAMLAMDERQLRLGTKGAIARPGGRPDADIPAPPALPAKPSPRAATLLPPTTALPPAVKRLSDEDVRGDLCEEGASGKGRRTIARLSETVTLFGLPCMVGNRADVTAFYIAHDRAGTAQRLRLPMPEERPKPGPGIVDDPSAHILAGDGFDAPTSDIGSLSMDYSPECGTFGHWRWTGAAFVLTSYERSPPACRGLGDNGSLTIHRTSGE